jgi:hypothetical protein
MTPRTALKHEIARMKIKLSGQMEVFLAGHPSAGAADLLAQQIYDLVDLQKQLNATYIAADEKELMVRARNRGKK